MTQLPRYDIVDVATKSDISELRAEMGELRSELRAEMGELRSDLRAEMGELRSDLRAEMGELRSDLRAEMGDLGNGLAAVNQRLDRLFLTLVAGLFVVIATMASVIFTVG